MTAASYNVKDFGAIGDGVANDAPAIAAAIDFAGARGGGTVNVPAGTYRLVPATRSSDLGGPLVACFLIRSNVEVAGVGPDASILRIANGISTASAPVRMAMFHNNGITSGWQIRGLTLDMNASGNPVNPVRGPFDNSRNQAHVSVSGEVNGVAARAEHVVIENNHLLNSPGTNSIVAGQTATRGARLGAFWTIRDNQVRNNGLNVSDCSPIYAWVDDAIIEGNTIENDALPVIGKGIITGCELHGARARLSDNRFRNVYRGVYVASNLTSAATDCLVKDNVMENVTAYGIDFDRPATISSAIARVVVDHNIIHLTDTHVPLLKAGINCLAPCSITDVTLRGNTVDKQGASESSCAVQLGADTRAVSRHTGWVIDGNYASGVAAGVSLSSASRVGLGVVTISNNDFHSLVGRGAAGVFARVTAGTIDSIACSGNRIDTASYGIRLVGRVNAFVNHLNSFANCRDAQVSLSEATIAKISRTEP